MKKSILTIFAILFATITFGQSLGSFPVTPNFGGGVAAVHRQRVIDASGTYVANTVPHSIDYLQSHGLWNSRLAFFPDNYLAGSILTQVPTDGSGDFDVARASVATNPANEKGLMEEVANNVARIDFSDGVPYLLLEPERENLIEEPVTLNDVSGYWNLTDATSTSGQFAPHADLPTGAFLLTATGANGYIELASAESISNTTDYTNSIYIKRITGTGDISISDINNSWSVVSGGTSTVDGWIRYNVTSESSSVNGQIGVKLATNGDAVRIAFAQIEEGVYPTAWAYSISAGEGATYTRLADEVTGAGDATLFSSVNESGVFYFEGSFDNYTNVFHAISLSDGSGSIIRFFTTSTTTLRANLRYDGSWLWGYTVTMDAKTIFKAALRWKDNVLDFYINGVKIEGAGDQDPFSISDLDRLNFTTELGESPLRGKIRAVHVYNYLSGEETAALTELGMGIISILPLILLALSFAIRRKNVFEFKD